ncbi:hypothetical protein FHW74_004113 [Atlantibacter sp. RC6]|nr:hypothetical protein [Atlantibacter sp. RC6]
MSGNIFSLSSKWLLLIKFQPGKILFQRYLQVPIVTSDIKIS